MGIYQSLSVGRILIVDTSSHNWVKNKLNSYIHSNKLTFHCDIINCFDKALEHIKRQELSALILHNWKPNREGLRFLIDARNALINKPIIVVGRSDENDGWAISAYDCGADNYFVPSCSEDVIIARLNGLLTRTDEAEQALSISDMKVWTQSGVAFRAGKPIKLSSKEMELLLYLVANKSRPVSRMEILKEVFGLSFEPGTNVVAVHIHRLRQKIDTGTDKRLLNTVRGEGYMLG